MINTFANDNSEGIAFIIETADSTAGVIVRHPEGYRFFAANQQFTLLDGSIFKSSRAAQQAAELMRRAAVRDHATAQQFAEGWDRDGRPAQPRRSRA